MSVNLDMSHANDVTESDSMSREDSRFILKGGWWTGVRFCVVVLCFWSVVASAAVTAAIAIRAYEEAVDDTRDNGQRNVDSCFAQSERSLTHTTVDLLSFNAVSVSDSVRRMLRTAITASDIIANMYVYTNNTADKSTWEYIHEQRKLMLFTLQSMNTQGLAATGVSVHEKNGDFIRYFYQFYNDFVEGTFVSQNKGPPFSEPGGVGEVGFAIPNDGALDVPFEKIEFTDFFGLKEIVRDGIITPQANASTPMWRNTVTEFSYSGILLTRLIDDPLSGKVIAIEVSLALEGMSGVLRGIAEDTMNNTHALCYLYTVVRSSPFYIRTQELGLTYTDTNLNEEGYLTAASNGSVYKQSETNSDELEMLKAEEASDPMIRGIAIGINQNTSYPEIMNSQEPVVVSSNSIEFIVQVVRITTPEGLDWWLVSAIDLEFIIGDSVRSRVAFIRAAELDNKATSNKIDDHLQTMYLVISSFALTLVVSSAFLSYRMLLPLSRIQEQMQKVSEMDLESTETVPTSFYELKAMQVSFEKMVRNLKEFKAYVPTAVLEGSQVIMAPPSGHVALVFTDIVSSTALWAKAPSAMNDALELHNSCIRKNVAKYSGYEVKTIGDAFMVAFEDPVEAVAFCLAVQVDFVKQKWPSDLDLQPHFENPNDTLPQWNGLRLRIGCQVGEAVSEENPLTGRADYRGSTVNMAARLESKALPGTVCISKELHQLLKDKMNKLDSPVVQDHGEHELKGIGNKKLVTLCPAPLASRLTCKRVAYETITSPEAGDLTDGRSPSSKSVASQENANNHSRPHRPSRSGPKKTGLSLASSHLTIAICNLTDTRSGKEFDNYNLMLRTAIDAAQQTDGVPGNVTGTSLLIIWNATKACKVHTTAAIRFASQVQWRMSRISRLGIATGKLLHGNVGNSTQRYHTAFGLPLKAAHAAAELGSAVGAFAVVADCTPDNCLIKNTAVSPYLRMVDVWQPAEIESQILLFQVLCESLSKQIEDGWGITDSNQTEADIHNTAFRSVISGNKEEIEKIKLQMSMSGEDVVLTNICHILDNVDPQSTPEKPFRARVCFNGLPNGAAVSYAPTVSVAGSPAVLSPTERGGPSFK